MALNVFEVGAFKLPVPDAEQMKNFGVPDEYADEAAMLADALSPLVQEAFDALWSELGLPEGQGQLDATAQLDDAAAAAVNAMGPHMGVLAVCAVAPWNYTLAQLMGAASVVSYGLGAFWTGVGELLAMLATPEGATVAPGFTPAPAIDRLAFAATRILQAASAWSDWDGAAIGPIPDMRFAPSEPLVEVRYGRAFTTGEVSDWGAWIPWGSSASADPQGVAAETGAVYYTPTQWKAGQAAWGIGKGVKWTYQTSPSASAGAGAVGPVHAGALAAESGDPWAWYQDPPPGAYGRGDIDVAAAHAFAADYAGLPLLVLELLDGPNADGIRAASDEVARYWWYSGAWSLIPGSRERAQLMADALGFAVRLLWRKTGVDPSIAVAFPDADGLSTQYGVNDPASWGPGELDAAVAEARAQLAALVQSGGAAVPSGVGGGSPASSAPATPAAKVGKAAVWGALLWGALRIFGVGL